MVKPKLLLHTCCAPCSGFLVQEFLTDFQVTIYFDNSNIYPEEEFEKRRVEAKYFFEKKGIGFMAVKYNHQEWLDLVKGLETELERGRRCEICYQYRLRNTAEYAKENNYDYFASTLAISPHKDADSINKIGRELAQKFNIKFLAGDWKKKDGFKKAMVFSHEHNFYHQNYCGCEFSKA